MSLKMSIRLFLALGAIAIPLGVASQTPTPPLNRAVSFQREIAPIFQASCIGCHSDKSPQGGLSLISHAKTMKGGKGGKQIMPNKSGESKIIKYLLGTAQPKMPIGGSLKPAQIELIRNWIDQGARLDPTLPDTQAPPAIKMPMREVAAPISSLAFSPDSKALVVGTYKKVQFWDIETQTLKQTWSGHADAVRALAFTKDGKTLVAGGGSPGVLGEARVWNTETNKETLVFGDHTDIVNAVAINPNGKRIVTGSTDKSLKVWEMETGKMVAMMRDHADAVFGLSFRPDGKYIASCSADRSVKVWDAETNKRRYSFEAHQDLIFDVAFSPDGNRLVSASADSLAKLWSFGADGSGHTTNMGGHGGSVLDSAFSADGSKIATVCADKQLRLYRTGEGGAYATLSDAKDWLYVVRFSPNNKWLAAGSWDGTVYVWNLETNKLAATLQTGPPPAPKPAPKKL